MSLNSEAFAELPNPVTPVKTGGQNIVKPRDSRFRGNDFEFAKTSSQL